jgi:hypothetical protein
MTKYSWQRYWRKSPESRPLPDGFLSVWEKYETVYFPISEFADIQCLILLGEPGMGKSTEIKRMFENFTETETSKKLFHNLSSSPDTSHLYKKIFEHQKFIDWKNGSGTLHLFLDSLDEALFHIETLSALLIDEFNEVQTHRLFVRLACRAAEWSGLSKFENELQALWGEKNFQILHLAPLQRRDIVEAAQIDKSNGESFLKEVIEKRVSTLAAKPVTFELLLNLFKRNSQFPASQSELYERGCLALLEEDQEIKTSERHDVLTAEQRFLISARIASVMIFSNKSSIWIGRDTGEKTEADISISELVGFSERGKSGEFFVDEKHIEITILKGLFTSHSPNRIRFSHQTFAEFLSAWYLNHRDLKDETVIKLIGEKYLYPQLYETSAWIAARRQNIFRHLMKIAPIILLRSDVISADENLRFELATRVLEVFDNEEARDTWIWGHYDKLRNKFDRLFRIVVKGF